MKCPKCQTGNPNNRKFCYECGRRLLPVCPKCGSENLLRDKFCGDCGHELRVPKEVPSVDCNQPQSYTPKFLADKILTTPSSIEGERKLVTVLFADVANSTAIFDKLDPEEVHQIMDGCFRILLNEVHRYKGTINQFRGDGIMALFGAPQAHEDHAQRACYAALAIQGALKGYSEELKEKFGLKFKMRIGINSGAVVVGSIGDDLRRDYTADGNTTNLASRMEGIAKPGTVLISLNTYRIVSQYFETTSLGKVKVKGMKEPLEVYELKEKACKPQFGLERKIYSKMVGRGNELDRLEIQVLKTVNGEGSIVNIIGEAGVGKSRLVAELKKLNVMKRVTLLEGRAISIGRNLSFHPIIGFLKQWALIGEDDGEEAAFNKLRVVIRRVCLEDVYEVLPFIATLMGMRLSGSYVKRVKGIEGEALQKLIQKNMRELLIRATELTPMVIVIEDLQWADTSSIELMESLFRLAHTQRILFINVFRPSHKETGDRIVKTIKERLPEYYVEITLQPLDEQMSKGLINNMLNIRGLPYSFIEQIVRRAGGNPFFIEEVIRSFIDEGAIVMKGGSFEVTEEIGTIFIPHTINDVLMARIDRLDEQTRNLVKVASVIGRSFFYRILSEVARGIENIDKRLEYLKGIQLVRERMRMEELEYLFKHALAQEAVYESILLQKRKALHLMVADSLERVFSNKLHEFYGMLAFHYSMGGNEEKAEEYLIKAGEEALKASASSEALHFFQQALSLYLKKHGDAADTAKIAMLERSISLAFYNKGQYIEAIEYFDKVLTHFGEKVPKRLPSVIFMFILCFFDFLISLYIPSLKWKKHPNKTDIEIINLFEKKINALGQTNVKRMFIETFYINRKFTGFVLEELENGVGLWAGLSAIFAYSGISFRLSKRILEFCKEKINKDEIKSVLYYELSSLMHTYYNGNWDRIGELDGNLVERGLSIGENKLVTDYVIFYALIKIEQGCFNEAQEIIERLYEIAKMFENQVAIAFKYKLNTKLLFKYRRHYDALNEIGEGIAFCNKTGLKQHVNYLYTAKAQIQVMLTDIKGAEESLQNAKEYLAAIKVIPTYLLPFLSGQLVFYLYRLEESIKDGDLKELTANRKHSLRIGRRTVKLTRKRAGYRTEALRLMGTCYWLIGKQKKALKWWGRSVSEGKRIGAHLELSRTYMEIGKRLIEPKSKSKKLYGIKAGEYLEKARILFEEMELQWDLDELDK